MESIGNLAGGIAHDFNNLMTAVTGYADLALRSLKEDDSLRFKIEEMAERVAVSYPETEVLYMSGFTADAIVRHGLLSEDFAFIQKPFSPESLASKARELLDRANQN